MGAPTVLHMEDRVRMNAPNCFWMVVKVNEVFYLQKYCLNVFNGTFLKYEAEYDNLNDAITALEERLK